MFSRLINQESGRGLTGGGRLREIPIVRLRLESFGLFDTWSLTGGRRIWRFDCIIYVSTIVGTECIGGSH